MRIPARIIEHPVEALLAGVLLLVLLFGSADRNAADVRNAAGTPAPAATTHL
jgi:hypothetical protein